MKNLFNPYFLGNEFSDKNSLKSRIWMLYRTSERKVLWKITALLPVLGICFFAIIKSQNPNNQKITNENTNLGEMWEMAETEKLIFGLIQHLDHRKKFPRPVENEEALAQIWKSDQMYQELFDSLQAIYPEKTAQLETQKTQNFHEMNFEKQRKPKPFAVVKGKEKITFSELPEDGLEIGFDRQGYQVLEAKIEIEDDAGNFIVLDENQFEIEDGKIYFSEFEAKIPMDIRLEINKVKYNYSDKIAWSSDFDEAVLISVRNL